MPDRTSKFFKFRDDAPDGPDPDGNLRPLAELGLVIPVHTMVDGEPVEMSTSMKVEVADRLGDRPARIVPDTRLVESQDYRVNSILLETGHWEQVDDPNKKQLDDAAKATKDSREGMERFGPDGEEKDPARGQATAAVPAAPAPDDTPED